MPRTPTVWFRKQTGWYCTKIAGVVHKLGRDEKLAQKAFHKLMGADEEPKAKAAKRHSVRKLCDLYLVGTRGQKGDDTHKGQVWYLKQFTAQFGHRDPVTLKVHEVTTWMDGREGWSRSTTALMIIILKAAFNWAANEGYLTESPIKKLKRRKTARRERVLTKQERETVRVNVSPDFATYLTVLEQTGCRPYSEAANLSAPDIDWENGRTVLRKHKNANKGKTRVVYFPPALLDVLKGLAAKYPTGPLLRNRLGNAWARPNVNHYTRRVYRKLKMEKFCPYSYRATYITDALVKGVPVEVVAELVGSSPKVIWAHYSSVAKKPDAMRAAALQAVS